MTPSCNILSFVPAVNEKRYSLLILLPIEFNSEPIFFSVEKK